MAVWLSRLVVEEVDGRTTGSRHEEKEWCYPRDAHSYNVESFQFDFEVTREKTGGWRQELRGRRLVYVGWVCQKG